MWLVLIVRYWKTFPWSAATTLIKGVYFLSSDPAEPGELVGTHGTVIDNAYTMFQQQVGMLSGPSNSPGKKKKKCSHRRAERCLSAQEDG